MDAGGCSIPLAAPTPPICAGRQADIDFGMASCTGRRGQPRVSDGPAPFRVGDTRSATTEFMAAESQYCLPTTTRRDTREKDHATII
jgi:hypothetical protein